MHSKPYVCLCWAATALAAGAHRVAPRQTDAPSPTEAALPDITAVTDCHAHGSELYCLADDTEYLVLTTPTATTGLPAQFTDCHSHDTELFCVGPDGSDVEIEVPTGGEESHEGEEDGHDHEGEEEHGHEEEEEAASGSTQNCHSHAGVEHCTGGDEAESGPICDAPNRDYNIGLRVGLLFVILVTSAIGVFAPILLHNILTGKLSLILTVLKQFGTGIIISTAFVHLYTHATLMFANECLGELEYEGTSSAIVMAGIFLSFLVEYIGQRIVLARTRAASRLSSGEKAKAVLSNEVVGILVMEAGIVFHSLLIGLTLVVSGDSFFLTLFVVILFHQVFEGIALGTRIASIGGNSTISIAKAPRLSPASTQDATQEADKSALSDNPNTTAGSDNETTSQSADAPIILTTTGLTLPKKLALASLFAFITPIGMAIGIGVLQQFNGNDRSTIVAIGTLDALSAGILVWVGVVEMWAADWMLGGGAHSGSHVAGSGHGELANADPLTVGLAGFGLVSGMVLMSVLGKWA